jgi:hypothetical protein
MLVAVPAAPMWVVQLADQVDQAAAAVVQEQVPV